MTFTTTEVYLLFVVVGLLFTALAYYRMAKKFEERVDMLSDAIIRVAKGECAILLKGNNISIVPTESIHENK